MAAPRGTSIAELVPPDLAALLRTHPLTLQRPVWGRRHGRHASSRAGLGHDFRDHRAYVPGDDPRQLDWRAVARRDRLVLRQTEAEDELAVTLAIDVGANMGYGEGARSKHAIATAMAAALAWAALRQGDRAGLVLAGAGTLDTALQRTAAGNDRLDAIARALGAARPLGTAPLQRLPEALAPRLPPRSLVVLLTDWLDLATDDQDSETVEASLLQGLVQLRARRHDVVLLQVLHRDELTFPWQGEGVLRFVDRRGTRADLEGAAAAMRAGYLERVHGHLRALERRCELHGIVHHRLVTDEPLAAAFMSLLARLAGQPAQADVGSEDRP